MGQAQKGWAISLSSSSISKWQVTEFRLEASVFVCRKELECYLWSLLKLSTHNERRPYGSRSLVRSVHTGKGQGESIVCFKRHGEMKRLHPPNLLGRFYRTLMVKYCTCPHLFIRPIWYLLILVRACIHLFLFGYFISVTFSVSWKLIKTNNTIITLKKEKRRRQVRGIKEVCLTFTLNLNEDSNHQRWQGRWQLTT